MGRLRRIREIFVFDNWAEILAQRILFRGTTLQVYRINGVEMVADLRGADTASVRACMAGPMYRRFMAQMDLSGPLTVVDLGANAGGFCGLLKVLHLEVQHLLAVEMNPNTYERLRFNLARNFSFGKAVHAAVCGTNRMIEIPLGVGSTSDNIYAGGPSKEVLQAHVVEGMTLDKLFAAYMPRNEVDLLKVDIEGAEYELLSSGSMHTSSLRRCRYLLIELHPVEHYAEMLHVLKRHGFRLVDKEPTEHCGVHLFINDGTQMRDAARPRL